MRILLDTHCWLWLQTEPERLSDQQHELLSDAANEVFLSAASSWEIAIKWAIGKLPLPEPPAAYIPGCMAQQGIIGLPVQHRHALRTATLPPIHQDPFDRVLLAQAELEVLHFLTADRKLAEYPDVEFLWV